LLTDAAANALLKTLEEPPENTWFFLACQEPARCWQRCAAAVVCITLRRLRTYALAWLEREVTMSQDALLAALRLSANAPAAALDLLQDAHWAPRQQLCQILGNILTQRRLAGAAADFES
jgi:DNA polymerase-3 subunit delta'